MRARVWWGVLVVFAVGGLVEVSSGASYPTGQAHVTLVTPFNGLGNYIGVGQEYVNEVATGQWGVPLDGGSLAVKGRAGVVTATAATRAKDLTMVVAKAGRANIAAIAIQAAMLAGTYYLNQWLGDLGYRYEPGNPLVIQKPSSSGHYVTTANMGNWVSPYTYKVYSSSSQAISATCMNGIESNCSWKGVHLGLNYNAGGGGNYTDFRMHCDFNGQAACGVWPYTTAGQNTISWVSDGWMAATETDLYDAMSTSLSGGTGASNGDRVAQSAMAATAPWINESNKEWPTNWRTTVTNNNNQQKLSPTQITNIQNIYNTSITPADEADLEDDPVVEPEENPATSDWEYTPEQMAAAQYQKDKQLDAEQKADYQAQGVSPGVATEAGSIEKDTLTGVLEDNESVWAGSELYDKLMSYRDQDFSGGTCAMSVSLGPWGLVTFSFCEWETELEMLGNLMLAVMALAWGLWFFKGRGDAV